MVNARFYHDGELSRRRGLVRFAAQGGTLLGAFYTPGGGFFMVAATSTGTIESTSA